jgi:DNA-binding transcriptional LysR family regulator
MDLRSFDLNLLVVLHTLIAERSVSNTAKKLHLSQPATSAALKRLRLALGDQILVREGLHMVLTPRAEALFAPLEAILGEIERTLISPEPFNPAVVDRTMRIATNDYGAFILIPPLMQQLQALAPGIQVEVWEIGRDAIALKDGTIDLAIADAWSLRQCPQTENLLTETFTCLVRKDHPRIQGKLTLEQYLAEDHILVSPRGRVLGHVDGALADRGLRPRRVSLTLPHVLAVPATVAATDGIVTVATRIAQRLAGDYQLQLLAPPIELDSFQVATACRSVVANDPAIQWLRGELVRAVQLIQLLESPVQSG